MPHVNKKFRSLTEFFSTSNSRSLENSDMNTKPLSICSTLQFVQQQNQSKVFHVFHFCFKSHSNKIDLKEEFPNTPLRAVKKQAP